MVGFFCKGMILIVSWIWSGYHLKCLVLGAIFFSLLEKHYISQNSSALTASKSAISFSN